MNRLVAAVVTLCLIGVVPATAAKSPEPRRVFKPPAYGTARLAAATPGDVTGDGRADAVARDPGPEHGTLRLHTHNGGSSGALWPSSISKGGEWDFADLLLFGDVTGDGRSDIVARDPEAGNGTLWIYPYDGEQWTNRYAAGTGWNRLDALVLGDVTGDGRPDLLGREPTVASGTLWVYRHNGTANPWTTRDWAGTGWNLANALLLDDATGDGHRDIVARDHQGALWIYRHNGASSGNPYTSRSGAGTGWELARNLLLADVTGDGQPDVGAVDTSGELWIYPHSGATSGNPYTVARFPAGTGWQVANTFLVGDVNGDGRPDILGRLRAGDLWVYPNDGTATPWSDRFTAGARWTFENQLILADVTGDHRPEIVARDPAVADGTLWIYPHNGSTSADPWNGERVWAGTGWNLANAMLLGDLTGDGWADILARDRAGDLWIYPHNGASSGNRWTAGRQWAGTGWHTAKALALGDVTGDGRPDLVDLESDGTLWIYPTGSDPIQVPGDWQSTVSIALADVAGSNRLDLVSRDTTGTLWLHPHNGSADPWPTRHRAGTGWTFASVLMF